MLTDRDKKAMNLSMTLSFVVGIFMLILKVCAYWISDSAAVLSDASESVIHVFAVGFAAYSMRLSLRPADDNHLYGHEKIGFFSAGFEGALIILAAGFICYEALEKIYQGIPIQHIDAALPFVIAATLINLILGLFLVRKGKRYGSLILEANGKHILTDSWTSFAVILALVVVYATGLTFFDPLIAFLAAGNILWTGCRLIKRSVMGLMDETDLALHKKIQDTLDLATKVRGLSYHHLRSRSSGQTVFIEFHLLFPQELSLGEAHEIATALEVELQQSLPSRSEVVSHLEPLAHHDDLHKRYGLPI